MNDQKFVGFDPKVPARIRWGNLPHWEQDGCTYFITFRTDDAIPTDRLKAVNRERKIWLDQHPPPRTASAVKEFHRLFSAKMYRWMDENHGQCELAGKEIADLMESTFRYFDGERYILDKYVVVPNHVHLIIKPLLAEKEGKWCELGSILHSVKSFTATKINRMLGKSGTVWQKEYFDHIIRGWRDLEFYRNYVEKNPEKAGISVDRARVGCGLGLK